jgi:hypothetical protein
VSNASVFGFPAIAGGLGGFEPFAADQVDDLPDVPALPETLLQLELKLHEFSIDLHEVSQLVLSDLGTTLQILRLAVRECGIPDARPSRIEDCISDLGLEACLRQAGRRTVLSEARHRGVIEVWAHSREVAQLCKRLAGTQDGWMHPEEAYLVGLMHALGSLPGILGWQWPENEASNWTEKGSKLAELWSLPLCVQEFFEQLHRPSTQEGWTAIVRRAHGMARLSPRCPMCEVSGPQLCRRD